MPNDATNGSTETPETGNDASKPVTLADLDDYFSKKFESAFAGFHSKVSGELAGFRKQLKGGTPAAEPKDQGGANAAAAGVTQEDLIAIREVGKLEAKLGEKALQSLGENYASMRPTQQVELLRMVTQAVTATQSGAQDGTSEGADGSRGEMPARTKHNPRGTPPAPRDSVPRPANKREYIAMKPEQRALLSKDPSFDPTQLAP